VSEAGTAGVPRIAEDEWAFASALESHVEAAHRVARSAGLSAAEAADAVQEASIRAWRHRASRRGDFRPWFLAIVYRESIRPRRRWLTLPMFWQGQSGSGADDHQAVPGLDEALGRLPRRQRLALSLRYDADLSVAGVAAVLGTGEDAAKQLLARARDALRRQLAAVREDHE
jgi:RNA polymerase sigma-70 factor (ECF subfamily)